MTAKSDYCGATTTTTTMAFASRPGCPMCSIVQSASHTTPNSPRSPSFPAGSTSREVLWRDENLTAYREKGHAVSSKGHIVVALKQVLCCLRRPLLIAAQSPRSVHLHSRAFPVSPQKSRLISSSVIQRPAAPRQHQKPRNPSPRFTPSCRLTSHFYPISSR